MNFNGKYFWAVALFFCVQFLGYSQKTSKNNYTGNWTDNASWVGNVAPPTANIGAAHLDLNIFGYITRVGNLSFANVNADASGPDFIINDTLVITGNLTLANKAANLVLGSNGLLIVLGDFSADNKILVENGGIFVVAGDMSFSASGQDDYDNSGGGELFVQGSVTGNGNASGDNDWGNLEDLYPDIFDFVVNGGTLPIQLLYFNVSLSEQSIDLTWATSSEENFDHFELQRAGTDNQFFTIATVNGVGYNTQSIQQYTYNDENPLIGQNYYRLKAVDLDGSVEYFGVRFINFDGAKEIRVFPNPVNDSKVNVQINFEPTGQDRLVLIDQMGVELLTVPVNGITNTIELNQNINPGTYLLRYISATKQYTTRLVIR